MSTLTIDITRADSSSVDAQLLLGIKGDTGAAAGFGAVTASVDANIGTPSVVVTASGADTAKDFDFAFHNLKGEKGEAGDVADVQYDGVSRVDTAIASIPIVNFYGECITARATITKSLNIYGFELLNGVVVAIKFTYGNESIRSININSTGAKYITYKGETTTASTSLILDELRLTNSTGVFLYDGTNYVFIGCVYNVATYQSRGLMSSGDKSKLGGIEAGAEVNVQSDWDEADSTSDAYIKNKPTTRHLWFGVCTDGYDTKAKTVTTESGDFELVAGNAVCVQFTAGHREATMKLAVDGTTSTNVRPTDNSTDMSSRIAQGEIAMFVYTGTMFLMVEGGKASTSRYGQTKLSTSISSTATDLAATPSAVKQAYDLANGKADAVHTHEVADITDFPTIPTVNDATLTIQRNGADVVTFTANSASDATADITVPTDVSDLNDDIGIATLDDLSTLLPTDTASGLIASFPDGQSVIPAISVIADIDPIQDLHGYDKPWSGGTGANVLDPNVKFTAGAYYGLTLATTDGYNVKVTGTATGSGIISTDVVPLGSAKILPAGTYTGSWGVYTLNDENGNFLANKYGGTPFTMNVPFYVAKVYIEIVNGNTYDRTAFIALAKGSTAPTQWTPYSNICPISGRTECVTERASGQLIDTSTNQSGVIDASGNEVANPTFNRTDFIPIDKAMVYVKTSAPSGYTIRVHGYSSSKAWVQQLELIATSGTELLVDVTVPDGVAYVRLSYPLVGVNNTELWQGNTYTTTLGRTVYGGTLDVVSGELVVTKAYALLSDASKWIERSGTVNYEYSVDFDRKFYSDPYMGLICSMAQVSPSARLIARWVGATQKRFGLYDADGAISLDTLISLSSEGKISICYDIEPQTYQLTPQEVSLLLGTNNVWCDSGEVEVTYKADVGLYIDKKLNA